MSDSSDPRPIRESIRPLQAKIERVHGGPVVPIDPAAGIDAEVEAMWRERWHAVAPRRFWDATVADLEPEAAEAVAEWTASRPLRNLVVTGPVGTGKTHLAVAAVRDWHRRGARVWYAPAADLMATLRPGGDGYAYHRATEVDILVLDDIGATRDSEWTDEMLYRMVDARWRAGRAIVATTNLPLADLAARLGERVYERLCLSGAVLVQIGGESRRRR